MTTPSTLTAARPVIAAFAAMGILWGSFAAVLPDIKTQLAVPEATLGALLFFTPLAAVLAMLAAPRLGTWAGRAALPVAAMAMALAFALPGQVRVLWLFPLAMMACGAGTGLTDVLMNARVSAIEAARGMSLMNLTHAAYSFGYAGGAILTGFARAAHWPPAAVGAAMAALAAALALATVERDGRITGLLREKGAALGGPGWVAIVGGGMVLIAFLTENAAENWSALHIEKTLGGSPAQGAMGPATLALTMGVARLVGQGFAARYGAVRLLRVGAAVSTLGALIAAGAVGPAMAYAGFIIMGVGSSVIAPTAFSLVGQMSVPDMRARAVARATLYGYFGYFFGPPTLGFLAGNFGLRAAFVFAAVMLMVLQVLAPLMARLGPR